MKEKQLKKIEDNETITHCYIYKRGYYRPNWCGYTDRQDRAGVYTKADALEHARFCSEIQIFPIDIVEHNKMIQEAITELQERLLPLTPATGKDGENERTN